MSCAFMPYPSNAVGAVLYPSDAYSTLFKVKPPLPVPFFKKSSGSGRCGGNGKLKEL